MRYVCLIVFTLITCSGSALVGGQTASVLGELTSDSPVDFTAIHVELQDITSLGVPIQRVDVGYDGRFEIRNVEAGQYNVTIMTANETPVYRDVVSITSYEKRLLIKLPGGPKQQQPVSGLVSFRQLSHRPPKAARKAFEDAVKRYEKHDIRGSLASLQKAVALDPEYVQALNNLGARYMMMGRFDESISALQRATDLDPGTAIIHANLAQALILRRQFAMAERAARRALYLDRSDPRGAYMLGLSLVLQEKYTPEAVSNLRRSDTFSPRARLALGLALANTGSMEAAREAFASCLKSPDLPVRTEAERMLMRLSSRQAD